MIPTISAQWLPLVATGATAVWLTLACVLVVGRVGHTRRTRRLRAARALGEQDKRRHATSANARPDDGLEPGEDSESREALEQALRSDDAELRRVAILRLGHLGATHDWAIDGLITALTEGADAPARVATWLARLAPRPAHRLVPLLDHPGEAVRFWSVRLIGAYDDLAREHAVRMTRDPCLRVRAASLSTLRATAGPDGLRSALELLADPSPPVRAHACRAVAAIGGVQLAGLVVPPLGDSSWWVREAARAALRDLGPAVVGFISPGLSSTDAEVRQGIAIVLQDLGVVDSLVQTGHDPKLLRRVFAAGGTGLERAAELRVAAGTGRSAASTESTPSEVGLRWA
jgi:HEAT repeat protein